MKVHSGALKPEDQLTQHLPAQTGSALISTAPAGTAVARGCREPGDPSGKEPVPCHAGGCWEGRTGGEGGCGERQRWQRSPAAAFPTGELWKWLSLPPYVQRAQSPPAAGRAAGRVPFPCSWGGFFLPISYPFRRRFGGFSPTAPGPAPLTKNWSGTDQRVMLYC